jgi:hypothetical protein
VTAVVLLVAVVETEEQGEAEEPDQAVAQVVRPDLVAVVAQDKVEVLLEVLAVKAERGDATTDCGISDRGYRFR